MTRLRKNASAFQLPSQIQLGLCRCTMTEPKRKPPSVSREEIARRIRENWALVLAEEADGNETDGCDDEFRAAIEAWRAEEE